MRIATYNVEWFTRLFDREDVPQFDDRWSSRYNIKRGEQLTALGRVFRAMDADAVMIIEGPETGGSRSSVRAIENFAAHFGLRTNKALHGFSNDTQQDIVLMYDPKVLSVRHDPIGQIVGKKGNTDAPRFDTVFRLDLDSDGTDETVVFSKPPLEVALETKTGKAIRLIGVHAKSKAPHGARGKAEVIRVSIENRRKQLAQCIWVRQRIEHHLDAGESLIVMGDFNDGPGLDEYEKLFGRSSVEVVMGDEGCPCMYDPHARMAVTQRVGAMPSTSRFYLSGPKRYMQALLDYVMVSPDLMANDPAWRIWHPFDDPQVYDTPELREAVLAASDHFPVSLDIEVGT